MIYTVIFTYKNVYEKIAMSGTTTDYEALKILHKEQRKRYENAQDK